MATRIVTSIELKGPFFEADIRKTVAQNKREFMELVAKTGEADVRAQLQQGEGMRSPLGAGIQPARVSGHVRGRVRSLEGKHWVATAVVSINNRGLSRRQGVKLMAAASHLEATTHALRRTKSRLNRLGRRADLIKGLR